jgi:hypothetical protein
MLPVGDEDMTDAALKVHTIDKDGYAASELEIDQSTIPRHSSRLESVVNIDNKTIAIPEELPAGVQLRVSTIVLLHSVICNHSDHFFDAEWIGKWSS